ncbi:uncharacterized protein LOC130998474 [Salvia miltiorrhiza]|uniref:uncharacterized protein LOC130998474 n=1 Tax=Salvia miltiorrhiza TaxID=226208 RepID=UPI0025AD8813|nr:uncharacterized protein LOC130998474 [Salvia miltiorrhiza]
MMIEDVNSTEDFAQVQNKEEMQIQLKKTASEVVEGSLHMTYLGVPLFIGRSRASHFMSIKDRIVQKFSRWKGRQLSMAGRLCLVQSVIQSSIDHSMMIFRWPKSLLHYLDKNTVGILCGPRLIKGEDFIFKILRSRYLDEFCMAKTSVAWSSVWLGLKPEIGELVDNSHSLVGHGHHTRFWTDDWLGYKICDKLAIPSFMHEFLGQSVADYFFHGIWHFSANFVENYPEVVVDIITFPFDGDKDVRVWKSSPYGDVTAVLAFAHTGHRFPKLIRNGLIAPNCCYLYMSVAESVDHIFWGCPRVISIWLEILTWFYVPHLRANFGSWGLLLLFGVLGLGVTRLLFYGATFGHLRVLAFVRVSFMEVNEAFPRLGHTFNTWLDYLITRAIGVSVRAAPPSNFISVHSRLLVEDWIKVNTDGAASGSPGEIAAGGVYRDKFCVVQGCFHLKGGRGYVFEAELLAVITAIAIAHTRGWNKLWLEADSRYVVKLLKEHFFDVLWHFYAAWKATLNRLKDIMFRVSHIFHEGNVFADAISNLSRMEGWWSYGIDEIKKLAIADIATHSFSRKVR